MTYGLGINTEKNKHGRISHSEEKISSCQHDAKIRKYTPSASLRDLLSNDSK